jgi:hypothetical protein
MKLLVRKILLIFIYYSVVYILFTFTPHTSVESSTVTPRAVFTSFSDAHAGPLFCNQCNIAKEITYVTKLITKVKCRYQIRL